MKLNHCRTTRRQNGTRVKIEVRLEEDYLGRRGDYIYMARTFTCEKMKRKWIPTFDKDSYSYKGMSMDERATHEYESMFLVISEEELLEVKKELWLKMEPAK